MLFRSDHNRQLTEPEVSATLDSFAMMGGMGAEGGGPNEMQQMITKAKAAGKYKGRQPLKAEKVEKLKSLVEAGSSISAAARELGISRVTAHKYL